MGQHTHGISICHFKGRVPNSYSSTHEPDSFTIQCTGIVVRSNSLYRLLGDISTPLGVEKSTSSDSYERNFVPFRHQLQTLVLPHCGNPDVTKSQRRFLQGSEIKNSQ